MDLSQSFNQDAAGTAGFKDLTSQQVAANNDQFKMQSGPNQYDASNIAGYAAAAGSSGTAK